ncbi:uncharacterized protein LOC131017917 isoform X1 [Salvia miltiorrhiza]|uniref:uncharacterized protein LOC131017917 isoform X1 n=1 Tax=Salvia miltiorrhiza TaxID=226208 RepID=UPI0025AD31DD|nr:uncharacterized protein LOC131017917 isoform X1 [Salvia miltiorrhiza]XP_057802638.1 uncharacterized protein LOC131017917 isoform X1 [Salvia miltiorrhiza]XP_057802639.1 uncharacterized protein LOC131017917 isoform X1 [Salvia miltiorrhiza]
MESLLVRMCIEAATESAVAVDKWRRQRRTLERMPSHLAEALLRHLLHRRMLYPSLLEVFKYSVEAIDLRGESFVDAEWMAYLGAFRYLNSLILADCHKINNAALWNITGMTNLKELDLSRCSKITDAGIQHLLSLPALEKLRISETGVTADGVAILASLQNLLLLDLGGLPVTDSALNSLQTLTKLQHLDLWGSEVSNDSAIVLKMFPNLSFLNLAWTNVTTLPNLPSLTCLNMSNCTIDSLSEGEDQKPRLEKVIFSGAIIGNISEVFQHVETSRLSYLDMSNSALQSYSFLSSMNAMSDLNLSGSGLVDDSVEHIVRIGASLKHLNLNNTKVSSEGVNTFAGHVPNLETLLLSGTPIDDAAVSFISMMPALKVVDLSRTHVKGLMQLGSAPDEVPSFSALESLNHLESLDLELLHIKDAAVRPLTNMSRLSYLSLRSVSLTDEALYHISSAAQLTHLGVRDAVVTDIGLDAFAPPTALEILDLRGCWLLTKDVLLRFCQKHPQLEVRHEFLDKIKEHSSPSRATTRTPKSKNRPGSLFAPPLGSGQNFLDQRLKYSRQELLGLQCSPTVIPISGSQSNSLP